MIDLSIETAKTARKSGFLALADMEFLDSLMARGIRLCVDGFSFEIIQTTLNKDMNNSIERHEKGERIFRAIGESAPAFGMIGTLVGLV